MLVRQGERPFDRGSRSRTFQSGDEMMMNGVANQFRGRSELEFVEHPSPVRADCLDAEAQLIGGFRESLAPGHKAKDL